MAHCLRNNPRVTTAAEFVNRLFQHELLVSGMGVMTDDAAPSGNDPVNIGHTILGFPCHEPFFITMTGQAKCQRALFKELIAVVLAMRIMAKGTPPNSHRSVNKLPGKPNFFPSVAAKAKRLNLFSRESDLQWFDRLLMACKALLVDRCAMSPGTLIGEISMTTGARSCFHQSHRRDGAGLNQLMAILTVYG